MLPSTLFTSAVALAATVLASDITVPIPWSVTDVKIYNTRHGTGGT